MALPSGKPLRPSTEVPQRLPRRRPPPTPPRRPRRWRRWRRSSPGVRPRAPGDVRPGPRPRRRRSVGSCNLRICFKIKPYELGNISILAKSTPKSITIGSKIPLKFLTLEPFCAPPEVRPLYKIKTNHLPSCPRVLNEHFMPITSGA